MHLNTGRLMGVDFLPVSAAAVLETPDKATLLAKLRARHDATCPHCTTAVGYTQTVFGDGNPDATLMFIGEAPGAEEDRTGIPFVGAAGKKLDDIIAAMQLQRSDVYIANILKSRPPNNRTPVQPEIDACGPFLEEQIRIVDPLVIVTLGSPATKHLLGTTAGITRTRGQWKTWQDYRVMPTYHPAYLLRNYTPETRREVWSDMQQVMTAMQP